MDLCGSGRGGQPIVFSEYDTVGKIAVGIIIIQPITSLHQIANFQSRQRYDFSKVQTGGVELKDRCQT
jgi:hypothetical protein